MADFAKLEQAVLTSICEENGAIGDALRNLLATANITKRDNTGHSFYTYFDVDLSLPPTLFPKYPVWGPSAEVEVGDQELLMGFLLWFENDYPELLKGFQYCTKAGDKIDLHKEDLSAMSFLRPYK